MNLDVICCTCRPKMLREAFASMKAVNACREVRSFNFNLQGYSDDEAAEVLSYDPRCRIIDRCVDRRHLYTVRRMLMDRPEVADTDAIVVMDDDFVFIDGLDWATAAKLTTFPKLGVGAVSCGWAKSPSHLKNIRYEPTFERQDLVFIGGGLIFGKAAMTAIRQKPVIPWLLDDCAFSLDCFVSGLLNFRWLGSRVIHKVGSPDGILHLDKVDANMHMMPESLVRRRKTAEKSGKWAKDEYGCYVPNDSDLTDEAKFLHVRARRGLKLAPSIDVDSINRSVRMSRGIS